MTKHFNQGHQDDTLLTFICHSCEYLLRRFHEISWNLLTCVTLACKCAPKSPCSIFRSIFHYVYGQHLSENVIAFSGIQDYKLLSVSPGFEARRAVPVMNLVYCATARLHLFTIVPAFEQFFLLQIFRT